MISWLATTFFSNFPQRKSIPINIRTCRLSHSRGTGMNSWSSCVTCSTWRPQSQSAPPWAIMQSQHDRIFHAASRTGQYAAVLSMTGCSLTASAGPLLLLCVWSATSRGHSTADCNACTRSDGLPAHRSTLMSFKLVLPHWIKPFYLLILHSVLQIGYSLWRNKSLTYIDFYQWFPDFPSMRCNFYLVGSQGGSSPHWRRNPPVPA